VLGRYRPTFRALFAGCRGKEEEAEEEEAEEEEEEADVQDGRSTSSAVLSRCLARRPSSCLPPSALAVLVR
jgi:hypothetical protein